MNFKDIGIAAAVALVVIVAVFRIEKLRNMVLGTPSAPAA